MDITVKNLKVLHSASEETLCFEATVYIDGVKAGTACNRGTGGANEYHPYSLYDHLEAHAATLPRIQSDIEDENDPSGFFMFSPDADTVLDDVVQKILVEKDFDRLIKTRLLYDTPEGITQSKAYKADVIAKHLANPKNTDRLKTECCLNFLPRHEALVIFRAKA